MTRRIIDDLYAVCSEVTRAGWTVEPIDPEASDTDLLARLQWEQRRRRVQLEALDTRRRAIAEGS